MRCARYAVVGGALAALLLGSGCDDDPKPAASLAAADGGAADAGGLGGGVDAATPLVPITEWIHDLVTGYGPMSAPDTVDDKRLMDTEDPGAFDSLLQ
jgi:hypothetical protein